MKIYSRKKLWLVAVAMMSVTTPAMAWEYPDSPQALPYEVGMGTADAPYLITTAQQLANLAWQINEYTQGTAYQGCYFKLGADIDLNSGWTLEEDGTWSGEGTLQAWHPIGKDRSHTCSLHFDGDGHTIKGLFFDSSEMRPWMTGGDSYYSICGLFGYIQDGSISNLNIKGSAVIITDVDYPEGCSYYEVIGGLVASQATKVAFTEVSTDGLIVVTAADEARVGGLAAEILNSDSLNPNSEIGVEGCSNSASVTVNCSREGYAAGIAPTIQTSVLNKIYNYGDVYFNSKERLGSAAGIAGNGGYYLSDYIEIYNFGAITNGSGLFGPGEFDGRSLTDGLNYGAITNGSGLISNCYFSRLERCKNYGPISGNDWSGFCGGGLVGYGDFLTEVISCENHGQIDNVRVGGGLVSQGGLYATQYIDCLNEGDVIATVQAAGIVGDGILWGGACKGCANWGNLDAPNAGGILGFTNSGDMGYTITDCVNYGTVTATESAGGITPTLIEALEFSGNVNYGSIEGDDYVGGLIGKAYIYYSGEYPEILYDDCHNYGSVRGNRYVSGLGGCQAAWSRSHNEGDVRGQEWVGGLGWSIHSAINCYNAGNVEGNVYVGGLAYNLTTTREEPRLSSCFNYGEVTTLDIKTTGLVLGTGYVDTDAESVACSAVYYLPVDDLQGVGDEAGWFTENPIAATAETFASGRVCVSLNGKQEPTPWGQTLDQDAYPLLNGGGNPEIEAITTVGLDKTLRVEGRCIINDQRLLLSVYDLQGRQLYQGDASSITLPRGVYFIKSAEDSYKLNLK
ncbi:MAG: hypothetical protein LIO90_09230 [Bacteroidales bacterium]|nr:hypothetical protein [Bacteroidales bacterium]